MIFRVFRSMPLLMELVSVKDGFYYRHGAPNGAFAWFIPPKTATMKKLEPSLSNLDSAVDPHPAKRDKGTETQDALQRGNEATDCTDFTDEEENSYL